MKYTIYKLDGKFAPHRWWRNYDANNKKAPDIDIETYISNKGLHWTPLLNTRNEPAKYQTITQDNFDEIQLYRQDISDIPDYIKIEFTRDDGVVENGYYFINYPSIYNATTKLATKVNYTLDEIVTTYYKFHNHFKTLNNDMFYVRKHENRYKKVNNLWTFDINTQPYLNYFQQELNLLVKENKKVSGLSISQQIGETLNFDITETSDSDHFLRWKKKFETDYHNEFVASTILLNGETASRTDVSFISTFYSIRNRDFKLQANTLLSSGNYNAYEYIIVKPKGLYIPRGSIDDFVKLQDINEFWIIPISNDDTYYSNTYQTMVKDNVLGDLLAEDNIIGKIVTELSPVNIGLLLSTNGISYHTNVTPFETCIAIYNSEQTYKANQKPTLAFRLNGLPSLLPHTNLEFTNRINKLISNINTNNNYDKSIENNPHLLAPNVWKLIYQSSTNDSSILTSDYINIEQDNQVRQSFILSTDWITRLEANKLNKNKLFSTNSNELACPINRFTPIQCTAWANNYLQRNILDTGRNNTIKSGTAGIVGSSVGLGFSVITTILGIILSATGYGSAIGVPAMIGGIGGIAGSSVGVAKSTINLQNGLAQNETQRKNLLNQANSLNNPVGNGYTMLGYELFTTNDDGGIKLFTMGANDMDEAIINNDDNMYGYNVNKWGKYNDYLTCWDGNYILIDISRNYNTLFTQLKQIDSIFTLGDKYINSFLNALNNGITWFDNGNYIDLATDMNNYERVFPRATSKVRVKIKK